MREMIVVLAALLVPGLPGCAGSTWAEDADLLCRSVEKWQKDERMGPDQRMHVAMAEFERGAGREFKEAVRHTVSVAPDQRYAMLVWTVRLGPRRGKGVPGWKCEALRRGPLLREPTIKDDVVLAYSLAAEFQPDPHAKPETYKAAFLGAYREEAMTPEVKALLELPAGERAAKLAELSGNKAVADHLGPLLD